MAFQPPHRPPGGIAIAAPIPTLGGGRIDFYRVGEVPTVVKYHPMRSARAGHEVLQMLRAAGFTAPGRHRAPMPLGVAADDHVLLLEMVAGEDWINCLEKRGQRELGAAGSAAGWLARFQEAALEGPQETPALDAGRVGEWFDEIHAMEPRIAARLGAENDRLRSQIDVEHWVPVPSHGDFHPKNVLLGSGFTTVIDYDHFALRESAHDVGYCIGQWLVMSRLRTGRFGPGARQALAFWSAFERYADTPWDRVAVHVARTFVQTLAYLLVTKATFDSAVWVESIRTWADCPPPGHLEQLACG